MSQPLKEVVEEQETKILNQLETITKLSKDLKVTEDSLVWWKEKVISQKRMLKSFLLSLIFVPFYAPFFFWGPLPDNWRLTVSSQLSFYITAGGIAVVTIPWIIWLVGLAWIWVKE